MNTETICRYACSDAVIRKTFGGVFASDLLPRRIGKFSTFIINLDPHNLPGSHWIAVKFHTSKKSVLVFDSYGRPPTNLNILSFLKRNACAIYYNDQCFQEKFTNTCGHFCLYFLYKSVRFQNLDLKENDKKQNETFVTSFIQQNFKRDSCCQFKNHHRKLQKCVSLINMQSTRKYLS